MLALDELTKYYRKFIALRKLSLTVAPGEIVALLGPNGAGKTTAIRCIAGLLQPSFGSMWVDEIDVIANPLEAKKRIAYVPEVPAPYDLLTVEEQLMFIAKAYGLGDIQSRIDEVLVRLNLDYKRREFCVTLSKGLKQKVALACAFVRQPSIYLLDEPLIGIDPQGAYALREFLIERTKQGASAIISTHMLDTAERLADRMIIVNKGTKLVEGSMEELNQKSHIGRDATLEEVFLTLVQEAEEEKAKGSTD